MQLRTDGTRVAGPRRGKLRLKCCSQFLVPPLIPCGQDQALESNEPSPMGVKCGSQNLQELGRGQLAILRTQSIDGE